MQKKAGLLSKKSHLFIASNTGTSSFLNFLCRYGFASWW